MDTKGMVSGIVLFFSSTGLSLGAFVGGWLSDTLGFEWAATILCFTELFALFLWAVYVSTRSCRADITDENHPVLLSNPTD
ncbi:hypothetical protein LSAT2_011660 [Lamellibrachia satsuma]|nr:hypothetical protein LSAT2_011660 [Lamellibrachia satsuma]